MPLDTQSEALLAARRKANLPGVAQQTVAEVRASRRAWQASTPVPSTAVHEVRELGVPAAHGSIPIRVYRPDNRSPLPAVVYFHGGGFVIGDLDHGDALCRWLCRETSCVVVNVDYRLAPEHKYPAAAADGYTVVAWLAREGDALGIDPLRLAVAGSSAGGNLAAVAALMCRDQGRPALSAQVLAYPVTDASCDAPSFREFAEGYIVSAEDMRWYWRQYLERPEQAREAYACPLRARDLSALPPTLIITAECDAVRDDGERYAERLRSAGVAARLSRYPGTLHGFFAMPGANAQGTRAVAEAAAFLRETFKHGGAS